jgi:hypothetical protein
MNYQEGFVLTLVDGLSNSESYLMEAIYESDRFPICSLAVRPVARWISP